MCWGDTLVSETTQTVSQHCISGQHSVKLKPRIQKWIHGTNHKVKRSAAMGRWQENRVKCTWDKWSGCEMEILTGRQRQTQSRRPLKREYSSVFPIMHECRAVQEEEDGGSWRGGSSWKTWWLGIFGEKKIIKIMLEKKSWKFSWDQTKMRQDSVESQTKRQKKTKTFDRKQEKVESN